jgi:hypothetical protein
LLHPVTQGAKLERSLEKLTLDKDKKHLALPFTIKMDLWMKIVKKRRDILAGKESQI